MIAWLVAGAVVAVIAWFTWELCHAPYETEMARDWDRALYDELVDAP